MLSAAHVLRRVDLAVRLAETWVHRPRTPTRVVLDVTRRCNLRCEMCRTWLADSAHELDAEELADTLRQLPRLVWLDVTGGEPFIRRDIDDVLETIARNTPALRVLHFPTNGWFTARIEKATRRQLELRPEVSLIVTVSIDGPPDVHDRIRGVPGSFGRAIETYRRLRRIPGVEAYVGTTVTPSNHAELGRLEDVLRAEVAGFRASSWHWNLLQHSEHFFKNGDSEALPLEAVRGIVLRHVQRRGLPRNLVDVMELAFLVNLEFFRRGEPVGMHCQALRSSCFISPEGDVYPCHVYDRPVGNVRDTGFAELWASRLTRDARRDIERLACGGCFTPCEAYPTLAGAPIGTLRHTVSRAARLAVEARSRVSLPLAH